MSNQPALNAPLKAASGHNQRFILALLLYFVLVVSLIISSFYYFEHDRKVTLTLIMAQIFCHQTSVRISSGSTCNRVAVEQRDLIYRCYRTAAGQITPFEQCLTRENIFNQGD